MAKPTPTNDVGPPGGKTISMNIHIDAEHPQQLPLTKDLPRRDIWIYVDESQGPEADACDQGQPFRVGALQVERAIELSLVQGALKALSADPDRNEVDAHTLRDGHFHASEDTPSAHSHLCNAIGERIDAALFREEQWHFDKPASACTRCW
jgi:hypothetical protein